MQLDVREIGVQHPDADPDCEGCFGRGWAVFVRADEQPPHLAVQKCDECGVFEYDEDAVPTAIRAGVSCKIQYPCYVLDEKGKKVTAE